MSERDAVKAPEQISHEDIVYYIAEILRTSIRPVELLHLVIDLAHEKDEIVDLFIEATGGGPRIDQEVPTAHPLPLEKVIEDIADASVCVCTVNHGVPPFLSGFEEIRRECLARKAIPVVATPTLDHLSLIRHEAPAGTVIRAHITPSDIQVATLVEWDAARISIPRNGCRPVVLSKDVDFLERTVRAVETLCDAAVEHEGGAG